MPGGSKYEGPPNALAAYTAAVEASTSGAAVKGAKNPYTSLNGHMTSFLDADGIMAIRLSDDLTDEFRAAYDSGDVHQYGATMRGYSSVQANLLADTAAIADWFDRSWTWIGSLEPKPTKK